MRRKSDRTASKKSKPSPEKKEKVEKAKHIRRSRKQSSSSASESTEDPPPAVETAEIAETKASEPPKSGKEDGSKESPDQVWQVKSAETSGDVGEIKKLKLCLARPPSTPERVDRSPRSKRKHTRATSSSDTQSVEGEDKKKSKRRSRRCTESKDIEKNDETQEEETEIEMKDVAESKPSESEPDQSVNQSTSSTDETPMSTTHEEIKCSSYEIAKVEEKNIDTAALEDAEASKNTDASKDSEASKDNKASKDNEASKETEASKDNEASKESEASKDTEASKASEASEDTEASTDTEASKSNNSSKHHDSSKDTDASKDNDTSRDTQAAKDTDASKDTEASKDNKGQDKTSDSEAVITFLKSDIATEQNVVLPSGESPLRKRSLSAEKSEILELHAEESRCESSEVSFNESQDAKSKTSLDQDKEVSNFVPSEVSINKSTTEISGQQRSEEVENNIIIEKRSATPPPGSTPDGAAKVSNSAIAAQNTTEDSQTTTDIPNGEVAPLVVNRKRRWGSRPSKLSTQKSITISTDVLKEIIPDVKPAEFDEVIEEKKHKRIGVPEKIDRPVLPKIIIDNTDNMESYKKEKKIEDKDKENVKVKDTNLSMTRKISIVKEQDSIITRPPSPPRHKQSSILYITNLVRPFTLPQLKNLLQRTGRIVDNGFWIDRIKSKCYVKYETEDQAVETRHALHGVTWPVSNPKTLHVDFSTQEDFDKAKANEDTDNAQASTIPGTVEDWLREQDMKREKGELEKPWERKAAMREWDVGKNEKSKEVSRPDKNQRDERPPEKRRHRTIERSPEPARKFKKKEEEAPAKLLDDLFRKTKATPCIYWLPLSAETIAVKEEQRRQHMAEHERRLQLQEQRRPHRRH